MDNQDPVTPPADPAAAADQSSPMSGNDVVQAAADVVKSDPGMNPGGTPADSGMQDMPEASDTPAPAPSDPMPPMDAPAPMPPADTPAPTDGAPSDTPSAA